MCNCVPLSGRGDQAGGVRGVESVSGRSTGTKFTLFHVNSIHINSPFRAWDSNVVLSCIPSRGEWVRLTRRLAGNLVGTGRMEEYALRLQLVNDSQFVNT
jgi:hypothetical protein